jgi:hypothetical protein
MFLSYTSNDIGSYALLCFSNNPKLRLFHVGIMICVQLKVTSTFNIGSLCLASGVWMHKGLGFSYMGWHYIVR